MDYEKCPYCGTAFRIGAIEVSGRLNGVTWLENPESRWFRTTWMKRIRLFRSAYSTTRNALKCDNCSIVIFDPRDPKRAGSEIVYEPGLWNVLFSSQGRGQPNKYKDLV